MPDSGYTNIKLIEFADDLDVVYEINKWRISPRFLLWTTRWIVPWKRQGPERVYHVERSIYINITIDKNVDRSHWERGPWMTSIRRSSWRDYVSILLSCSETFCAFPLLLLLERRNHASVFFISMFGMSPNNLGAQQVFVKQWMSWMNGLDNRIHGFSRFLTYLP